MLDLQNVEIFRSVLESLKTGVSILDTERKICYWNRGAESITGYLRQEVLGRFCGEILLVKFSENKAELCEHSCPLVAAMRDGKSRESHVYLHHKSGYAVPVSMCAVPIRDAHGHVMGAAESFAESPCEYPRRPDSGLAVGHGLDAISHLPDRAFTERYLLDRVKFATRHSIPMGMICILLDHLKSLTEAHGLEASETMLNVVAHTLRNSLEPLDFVGRWSDDQFLALVTNCEEGALLATAERLKRLTESSEIVWCGDHLSTTASVGGTVSKPGESVELLLERAARALRQTVENGGTFPVVLEAGGTSPDYS